MRRLVLAASLVAALALPARAADMPIFDAHLHYNEEAFDRFPARARARAVPPQQRARHPRQQPAERRHPQLLDAEAKGDLWVVPFLRPYKVEATASPGSRTR